jgi:hypothetical protein
MSLEEFEDKPDKRDRRYLIMRSIKDFGMGAFYIAVGLVILFAKQLNFENENLMTPWAKGFAVLAMLYGVWRIYRGIKKDYYRE